MEIRHGHREDFRGNVDLLQYEIVGGLLRESRECYRRAPEESVKILSLENRTTIETSYEMKVVHGTVWSQDQKRSTGFIG